MANRKFYYNVKNRSAGVVVYTIPEDNITRRFVPGETKRIPYEELLHLSNQPGGRQMMEEFLQVQSEGAVKSFGIKPEPEYYMSEAQIVDLLKTGSLPAFLDCLDYAPEGVIELVKKFAVELPLTDFEKRNALKVKTGFDVDKAVANSGIETDTKEEEAAEKSMAAPANGARRTNSNYKIVS